MRPGKLTKFLTTNIVTLHTGNQECQSTTIQGHTIMMKVTPQSFETMRKLIGGFWIVVPAYLLLSLIMPVFLILAGLLLVAHTLELPIAFLRLKGQNVKPTEVVSKTLLYGFTWWLPKSMEGRA